MPSVRPAPCSSSSNEKHRGVAPAAWNYSPTVRERVTRVPGVQRQSQVNPGIPQSFVGAIASIEDPRPAVRYGGDSARGAGFGERW